MEQTTSNIQQNPKQLFVGLNLNSIPSQVRNGQYTYCLNGQMSSFDGNSYTIQNESANEVCIPEFPEGYRVIGQRNVIEDGFIIFWLANPTTEGSEIGIVRDCVYTKKVNAACLNLSVDYPILNSTYRRSNCGLETYWVDARNRARYINLDDIPYVELPGVDSCDPIITDEVDCNKLNLQPNFKIPTLDITGTNSGGSLIAGTYQFCVQYSNALGEPYTSFYSVTNPASIFDGTLATENFNFPVNRAISLNISNIDTSGIYDYFNLAVIKTINNTPTVELVATYQIIDETMDVVYTGQGKTDIQLSVLDVFERYEFVDKPAILTTSNDVLILADLQTEDRVSYQSIANQITLNWATYRLRGPHPYSDAEDTAEKRGYMRDEIYPYEIVFELKNGYITDGFHIPGRVALESDLEYIDNNDVPIESDDECDEDNPPLPRWRVYNTGSIIGSSCGESCEDPCYEGEWEYGSFAYWESIENYPCNSIYGELSDKPIRHHKFPDSVITHIHDTEGYVYPIGVKIDVQQVVNLINASSLTEDQKANIQAFKIVRGNRVNNSSIVAKGLLTNVLKYDTRNNIINPSTGESDDSGDEGIEGGLRQMVETSLAYTKKARNEARAFHFIIAGGIDIGAWVAQDQRYADAIGHLDNVLASSPFISQATLDLMALVSVALQDCIDHYELDVRGNAHAQAAKAVIDGTIDMLQNQLDLLAALAGIDTGDIIDTEANKYMYFPNYLFNDVRVRPDGTPRDFFLENTLIDESSKLRYAFHSPDTSFYQPFLGNILKLETIEYGASGGHIKEVEEHAKYQFISQTGYILALVSAMSIGFASGSYGIGSVNVFDGASMFTAYQAILEILYKTTPRKNFAYQWNAVGNYTHYKPVLNDIGNKQRRTDIAAYLSPGMINIGDDHTVNNYQRESSVYLKTTLGLPYTHEANVSVPKDSSKLVSPSFEVLSTPISSYYGSIKQLIPNQYGQLYSYETVDTGYEKLIDVRVTDYTTEVFFGGDTFINKFAYKSKIPFFIDNRVGFPNDSDVSYNELSNVGRIKYWFSTDVTTSTSVFSSIFSTMTQHFYWPKIHELYLSGMIFLFAYGIPYFFCESSVNVDMRQASNDLVGNFYPRVGTGIPDDWLQEKDVSIQNDNIYWYNKSFSKQNKETFVAHLPPDYTFELCRTVFPFRAVFSDPQTDGKTPSDRNNWRIFKPSSRFNFPQNFGDLVALDGLDSGQVLARFEQKPLLYNAMLTAPTSQADVYLGQSLFKQQVPPLDYANTDLGYIGSLHKFLLKTEYGNITIDSKRGQVFLISGQNKKDLTADTETQQVSKWFTEFLDFQILNVDKTINIDNAYKDIGLTGVYDSKFNRLILTKRDYKPLVEGIEYIDGKFYSGTEEIELTDTDYFCNYSFTASYDFDNQAWISLHTYIPNYYVGGSNIFYSGLNGPTSSLWKHNNTFTKFNNFYGEIHPYIIEYPYSRSYNDEILQNIKDYSRILKYTNWREFIETDDSYFNKLVIYSNQQCSGVLELVPKPSNNLKEYGRYPLYNIDSKTITYTKSGSFYQINTFWDMVMTSKQPIWVSSCENLSIYKELNQDNMDYGKRSRKKSPVRSKELKIRFILDNDDSVKIVSSFTTSPSMISYK